MRRSCFRWSPRWLLWPMRWPPAQPRACWVWSIGFCRALAVPIEAGIPEWRANPGSLLPGSPSWATGRRASTISWQLIRPKPGDYHVSAKEGSMASTHNGVVSNERWENLRRPAEDDDEINVGKTERVISGLAAA